MGWRCLKCGKEMYEQMQEPVGRTWAHACGNCLTFHVNRGNGKLRLMTAGEIFQLRIQFPNLDRQLAAAKAAQEVLGNDLTVIKDP